MGRVDILWLPSDRTRDMFLYSSLSKLLYHQCVLLRKSVFFFNFEGRLK